MKPPLIKVLLTALTLLLLTGCASEDLPEEEDTAILPAQSVVEEVSHLPEQFSLPYDPSLTLDPVTCAEGMQQTVGSLLYEGLFRLDEAFLPQPWLCENYTYDAEALRYTFTLRSGITFSDGSPLTAADVKATLDRARTSLRYAQRLSGIASVAAREDTVTVSLSAPNVSFPALLDIPIVKKGTENALVPTGSGPYFFSQEETGAHLIASQSWWRQEPQPTERIMLVEADGHDAMLYRFTSRDVQLITADLTGALPVSVTGDVALYEADTTVMQYVGINTTRITDAALRRALWHGIHRGTITQAYLSGHGTPAQFPISPASPLYPVTLEENDSFESFREALGQCTALPTGTLTLLVNEENSFKCSIAKAIADNCTAAGVPMEVQILPWADYLAALESGSFDLYYGEVRLTADWDLRPLLASDGALNYGLWADPQTEMLLARYADGTDSDLTALCTHLKTQCPILPVCFKSLSVLSQREVLSGLHATAAEPFYDLSGIDFHLKEG